MAWWTSRCAHKPAHAMQLLTKARGNQTTSLLQSLRKREERGPPDPVCILWSSLPKMQTPSKPTRSATIKSRPQVICREVASGQQPPLRFKLAFGRLSKSWRTSTTVQAFAHSHCSSTPRTFPREGPRRSVLKRWLNNTRTTWQSPQLLSSQLRSWLLLPLAPFLSAPTSVKLARTMKKCQFEKFKKIQKF